MPFLSINLSKIAGNARLVAAMIEPYGMRLTGVIKCCQGNLRVGRAMLAGGAVALADSRLDSLNALRRGLPEARLQLLRPELEGGQSADPDAAEAAGISFVSSAAQARLMLRRGGRRQRFCLMVEVGDGREGVPSESLAAELEDFAALEAGAAGGSGSAELVGLASNAACVRPEASLEGEMGALAQALRSWEKIRGQAPRLVSCGGSGLLRLLTDGRPEAQGAKLFAGVTELRCGEALLLGRIPGTGGRSQGSQSNEFKESRRTSFLHGAHPDAFILHAPVLEIFHKNGRMQVLCSAGIQDAGAGRLTSSAPSLSPLSMTSDYLVLDWSPQPGAAGRPPQAFDTAPPRVGDLLAFTPNYYGLLALMTSPFVEKRFIG